MAGAPAGERGWKKAQLAAFSSNINGENFARLHRCMATMILGRLDSLRNPFRVRQKRRTFPVESPRALLRRKKERKKRKKRTNLRHGYSEAVTHPSTWHQNEGLGTRLGDTGNRIGCACAVDQNNLGNGGVRKRSGRCSRSSRADEAGAHAVVCYMGSGKNLSKLRAQVSKVFSRAAAVIITRCTVVVCHLLVQRFLEREPFWRCDLLF